MTGRALLYAAYWTFCCLAWAPAGQAAASHWSCDAVVNASGEATHRDILIDLDRRTVRDDMTWTNGAASPDLDEVRQFVDTDGRHVVWGNRHAVAGPAMVSFTLDLRTGLYALSGALSGELAHGLCRNIGEAT